MPGQARLTSADRDEISATLQWPQWLENLISVVHYNFPKGLFYFCISCNKGLYQERHFLKGADHYEHSHLRTHEHQNSVCVRVGDLEDIGLDLEGIQAFSVSNEPGFFVFLHPTHGYSTRSCPSWGGCSHCSTVLRQTNALFCCLECKLLALKYAITMCLSKMGRRRSLSNPIRVPHPSGFEPLSSREPNAIETLGDPSDIGPTKTETCKPLADVSPTKSETNCKPRANEPVQLKVNNEEPPSVGQYRWRQKEQPAKHKSWISALMKRDEVPVGITETK